MANGKLLNYKKKRDFKQTQDPSGVAPVKTANRLRFIIQKHDRTRLHYDLRPELDGVFKSWAVTTTCTPLPPVVLQKPDAARSSAGKPLSWAEAKSFAHEVCQEMARDNPDLYLIKMTKSLREGRIFLDDLRNDRMATAVAPLSPRAAGCHRVDATHLDAGPIQSRPKALYRPHRPGAFGEDKRIGGLLRWTAPALSRPSSGLASIRLPHDI